MKIVKKKISEIIPYENNPRNNDDAVDFVANSIKEFGFKVPIIIDKNNVIVSGHTRVKACEKLGIKEVDCVLADDLSEDKIKKLRIADNKTGEIAFWDNALLKEEFLSMDNFEDMADFGFADFELNILMGDFEPEGYDDDLIEEYAKQGENLLKKNRVIINYTDEEKEMVQNLLKVEDIKVLYDIKELVKDE